MKQEEIFYKNKCFVIQGAIFEVYKRLGVGFVESVYHESLEIEFMQRKVPFEAQKEIRIIYKGKSLNQYFKADLIAYGKILIELKAVSELIPNHRAQILNYLKATGIKLGLLVNFCAYPKVEIERIVL